MITLGSLNIFELINDEREASLVIVAPLSLNGVRERLLYSPPAEVSDWALERCKLKQLAADLTGADADWFLVEVVRNPRSPAWELLGWRLDAEADTLRTR